MQKYRYLSPYGKFSEIRLGLGAGHQHCTMSTSWTPGFGIRLTTGISGILTSIEESWNALDREVAYDFYTDPVNQDLRLQLPIEKCLLFYKTKLEDADKETANTMEVFSIYRSKHIFNRNSSDQRYALICTPLRGCFLVGGFVCRLLKGGRTR